MSDPRDTLYKIRGIVMERFGSDPSPDSVAAAILREVKEGLANLDAPKTLHGIPDLSDAEIAEYYDAGNTDVLTRAISECLRWRMEARMRAPASPQDNAEKETP